MRIVTGTISHESSTFTTVATTWESYRDKRFGFLRGDEVFAKFRGTNTAIGGFLSGAKSYDFEVIPTIFANAHPSGPTPRNIFDEILNELLERIDAAGPIDGIFLDLHGAMVAEGIDDGEGHILAAVRKLVGPWNPRNPGVPIIAQLDIHSNVSKRMVSEADVLIGHETYPEIDQEERAKECAHVMHRILREGLKPTMALHQIPLVWGMNQVTAHSPMREAIEELHKIEARPNVICGSIATCFPLADIPDLGASVYIATDNDLPLAQQCADELAAWIWERREQWHIPTPSTCEVLREAERAGQYPVIFADRNDNTGGGAPGDSTGMLRTFIEEGLKPACVLYIVDPEAVALCAKKGVGATLTLDVGAKTTPLQGDPVEMTAQIVALSDGRFRYEGPRNRGLEGSMGPSAHIQQDGVHVLLVSNREQPFGIAFSLTMDLNPKEMNYIGVKSAVHFRAGFESWAGNIYVVSEPSVHAPLDGEHHFENLGRKLYPFDDI